MDETKQKIVPHLWFDKEAKEAAVFYTSVFDDSAITSSSTLPDTPSGTVDTVSMRLMGQDFMMISAGPYFRFNPSISFLVSCFSVEEVNTLWTALSKGGLALMELGSYPFSERYGWVQDRFGLSWQIMLVPKTSAVQRIIPNMLFVGKNYGKTEEAIGFYSSVFHDSRLLSLMRYGSGEAPDREGAVKHASFVLEGQEFGAMDSAHEHSFTFNEAVSFVVMCDTQEEIDHYWDYLTNVPESEQCGWLKDKYGVSWQIVPRELGRLMADSDEAQRSRITQAFLKMKKFDIAGLKAAYQGM